MQILCNFMAFLPSLSSQYVFSKALHIVYEFKSEEIHLEEILVVVFKPEFAGVNFCSTICKKIRSSI